MTNNQAANDDSITLKADAQTADILTFLNETQTGLGQDINNRAIEFFKQFAFLERQNAVILYAQTTLCSVMANMIRWAAENAAENEDERLEITKGLVGRQANMLAQMLEENEANQSRIIDITGNRIQ